MVVAVFAVFSVLPTTAAAQWQWVDRQGKKVFSDQAPPPDIPERSILQRAGSPAPRSGIESTAAATGPAGVSRPAGVDAELQEKTRRAEAEEKSRQTAEAEKIARAKSDNCNRARQGKATYDSGIRVARLNAQGEREILGDAERSAENRRLQSVIDSDCN